MPPEPPQRTVPLIAVAALSARMLAEAAARDGFGVIALDLFGDADTLLASSEWRRLGAAGDLHLDEARTLAVLRELTQRGGVAGWIAGSGFEGRPELLDKAASLLPLVGTPPEAVARVRDPAAFFGFLDAHAIAHPPVRLGDHAEVPADGTRWLVKDAGGCGGWHIRRATEKRIAAMSPRHYLQQEVGGTPMSATFIADGRDAVVLGFNELTVRAFGIHPHVYCGAVGPVPLPRPLAARLRATVNKLSAGFALRGLCGLDFMCDGDDIHVLEVNPRPPASMALYETCRFGINNEGLVAAHLRACQRGELPAADEHEDDGEVLGTEIVYARRAGLIDDIAVQQLVCWPDCHDLPCAGTRFDAGDPVCSLGARGASADEVRRLLEQGREALLDTLETCT